MLLMFNRVGERNPNRTVPRLQELTWHLWQGERLPGGHYLYDRKIPIIAVGPNQLRQLGPAGAVFRRFGRPYNQTLLKAIGNPRREAHDIRQQAEYDARQREHQEELRRIAAQHKAEREARRPVCADCGARFTDERWKAVEPAGWSATRESHPHLCGDCKQRVHAAEREAV
ncbi:hypothetical protein [Streptomyces roseolus]|uniref:hypothetical protein n=1 Tax=Streptomyces roseolus TaxID=67358 RepID=UPI003664120E